MGAVHESPDGLKADVEGEQHHRESDAVQRPSF
jgi:hypothetical protein